MIDHSDSTINCFPLVTKWQIILHSTAALITNISLTSWGNEMIFTEKIEKELI